MATEPPAESAAKQPVAPLAGAGGSSSSRADAAPRANQTTADMRQWMVPGASRVEGAQPGELALTAKARTNSSALHASPTKQSSAMTVAEAGTTSEGQHLAELEEGNQVISPPSTAADMLASMGTLSPAQLQLIPPRDLDSDMSAQEVVDYFKPLGRVGASIAIKWSMMCDGAMLLGTVAEDTFGPLADAMGLNIFEHTKVETEAKLVLSQLLESQKHGRKRDTPAEKPLQQQQLEARRRALRAKWALERKGHPTPEPPPPPRPAASLKKWQFIHKERALFCHTRKTFSESAFPLKIKITQPRILQHHHEFFKQDPSGVCQALGLVYVGTSRGRNNRMKWVVEIPSAASIRGYIDALIQQGRCIDWGAATTNGEKLITYQAFFGQHFVGGAYRQSGKKETELIMKTSSVAMVTARDKELGVLGMEQKRKEAPLLKEYGALQLQTDRLENDSDKAGLATKQASIKAELQATAGKYMREKQAVTAKWATRIKKRDEFDTAVQEKKRAAAAAAERSQTRKAGSRSAEAGQAALRSTQAQTRKAGSRSAAAGQEALRSARAPAAEPAPAGPIAASGDANSPSADSTSAAAGPSLAELTAAFL